VLSGLDLFSGYGGIARGISPWVRTIAYCEVERYRQAVLLSEMQRGRIDRAPIWDDVRTLRAEHLGETIDIISGGWPCTGHSVAGARKGLDHVESSLVSHLIRLFSEIRPRYGFLENVPGVFQTGFDRITAELAKLGYVGRYGVLSCYDVEPNAWHERRRVWIALADASRIGGDQGREEPLGISGSSDQGVPCVHGETRAASDGDGERLEGWVEPEEAWPPLPFVTAPAESAWDAGIPQPTLQRKIDGAAAWRSQIECLGGGVVPCVAREAFKRLFGLEEIK
jgi:site-specific DNA-cytosine methylase